MLVPPGNILVVNNSPEFIYLASQIMIEKGQRVRAVEDPFRAIEAAPRELPDQFLPEFEMPDFSGYKLFEELNANKLFSILLTIVCKPLTID